ncbi:MAG: M48 family metallopeptidase [Phocaeicola sp.]
MDRKRVFAHGDFSVVVVTPSRRAVQMTFRVKPEALYVTVPLGTRDEAVCRGIDELRDRLLVNQKRVERRVIDFNFKLEKPCFQLSLVKGSLDGFHLRLSGCNAEIVAPATTHFEKEEVQEMLHRAIEQILKRCAAEFLPPLLRSLSLKHQLPYKQVKITGSKGRWGSCSQHKVINLSCYLMLLPLHLIESVLLHELAHTKEMNHGEAFWTLLDRLSEGRAWALREELKQYDMDLK